MYFLYLGDATMRTEQLQYLITLKEFKSISQACIKLNISHQGLSNAISSLEKELGYKVLHRTTQGVCLTEAGHDLVNSAIAFFNKLEDLQKKYTNNIGQEYFTSHINLILTHGTLYTIIPSIIPRFFKKNPSVKVEISNYSLSQCLQMLDNHICNFVFANFLEHNPAEFDLPEQYTFLPVIKQNLYVYAHKKFSICDYNTVSYKTIFKYPLVISSYEKDKNYSIMSGFENCKLPSEIYYETNLNLANKLVLSGYGITFSVENDYLDQQINQGAPLKKIFIKEKFRSNNGFIYLQDSFLTDDEFYFIREIQEIAHNL